MNKIIFTLGFILLSIFGNTQSTFNFEEVTDAIFQDFDKTMRPGITLGILEKGEIVYLKGFGIADIETQSPITVETRFQADDFAKQFTVLAILILEEQGKVNLEDDIRKYITRLPLFKDVIKLKHVVNHTTGLNDYYAINRLRGASTSDIFTHEDALQLICSQKKLNHIPGTHFSLNSSDTEITLLAEIVQKVSGESLASFVDKFIFERLGMNNTLLVDDHEMIIDNLAKSYQSTDKGYKYRVTNSGNVGPTNLYTSAKDLAIWYAQFSKTKTGFAETIKRLHTPVTLDNGKMNHDSWGRMSIGRDFYHMERGIPKYWLYGLHGSYGANMFLYPEQDIVGIALGNNDSYNGYYAMVPLEPLLKDHYTAPPIVDFSTIDTKTLSKQQLQKFEGYYWDEENQSSRSIFLENDTLRFGRPGTDRVAAIIPLSNTSFQMVVNSDDIILLNFQKEREDMSLSVVSGGSDPTVYKRFNPKSYSATELAEFKGIYFNHELSLTFNFTLENGQLVSDHIFHGEATYDPEKEDVFRGSGIYFSSINFVRDESGAITGFNVTSPGIKKLRFTKAQVTSIGSS